MITDKQVEAAVIAQSQFSVRPELDRDGWAVFDNRSGQSVEIAFHADRKRAEDAVLWHGQKAALEAAEKAAWRPISEAPRDGTEVLLVDQRTDTQVVAGWSGQPEPDDAPVFGWETLDGPSYMTLTFTHFRPLPKGPSND